MLQNFYNITIEVFFTHLSLYWLKAPHNTLRFLLIQHYQPFVPGSFKGQSFSDVNLSRSHYKRVHQALKNHVEQQNQ